MFKYKADFKPKLELNKLTCSHYANSKPGGCFKHALINKVLPRDTKTSTPNSATICKDCSIVLPDFYLQLNNALVLPQEGYLQPLHH